MNSVSNPNLRALSLYIALMALIIGLGGVSQADLAHAAGGQGVAEDGASAMVVVGGEASTFVGAEQRATTPKPHADVSRVRRADLGNSWVKGCPTKKRKLRAIDINHWDYDGELLRGRIIVHRKVVPVVRKALRKAFKAGFPIHEMSPVQKYDSSDNKSMRADNTSGFSCRRIPGSTRWSEHAKGIAVDINPRRNPHVFSNKLLPGNAKAYVKRKPVQAGMLTKRSVVSRVFRKKGWTWGGTYRNPDYQHYSRSGY